MIAMLSTHSVSSALPPPPPDRYLRTPLNRRPTVLIMVRRTYLFVPLNKIIQDQRRRLFAHHLMVSPQVVHLRPELPNFDPQQAGLN
jgi:hypothetical protein